MINNDMYYQGMTEGAEITVLGELHTDLAGLHYIENRIDTLPAGSTLMLEFSPVINGPIAAFMDDKISLEQLTTVWRGALFSDGANRAETYANLIAQAKEQGIQVMAYDPRESMEAHYKGMETFEYYNQRKTLQAENELQEARDDIGEKSSAGQDVSAFIASAQQRQRTLTESRAIINQYKDGINIDFFMTPIPDFPDEETNLIFRNFQ